MLNRLKPAHTTLFVSYEGAWIMDCIPPVGDAADDPYIDGNLDIGTGGSIPPEAAIEHLVREIVSAITALGGTADSVRWDRCSPIS